MPLLDLTRETLVRLKKADAARSGVEEAQALGDLAHELQEKLIPLQDLALRVKVFKEAKVQVTPVEEAKKLSQKISSLSAPFRDTPKVATLKQGKKWKVLLEALDTTISDARKLQSDDWKRYCSTRLFAGSAPDTVRARLAPTSNNLRLLAEYGELFKKFHALRQSIPSDPRIIEEIQEYSTALKKFKFDENVPTEVATFLQATQTDTGAGLKLLTDTVLDWLRSNQSIDEYVVRARVD